jgi:FkbM family methyltransferase
MSVSPREVEFFTLLRQAKKLRKQVEGAASSLQGMDFHSSEPLVCDMLVTYNEVCPRHGTGTLLINLFGAGGEGICSLRSHNSYGGEQSFATWRRLLDLSELDRGEAYRKTLDATSDFRPRRILSVPFNREDIWITLALKDAFDVPLCVYLMDDNCLFGKHKTISRQLMKELLQKADLRLSISREFTKEYERQFAQKLFTVPPLVQETVILREVHPPPENVYSRGVMIGNIWSAHQLDALRRLLRESGRELDWYSQNFGHFSWMKVDEDEMRRDGLHVHPPLAEADLQKAVRKYHYTVVPSGELGSEDDAEAVARLSLPSRILFLMAASQLPIVVLGDLQTAAGKFVTEQGVGVCCAYVAAEYERCLQEEIFPPAAQQRFRERAWHLAPFFNSRGMGEWIWKSLENGAPVDERFEALFAPLPGDPAPHVEAPVPQDLYAGFHKVYRAIRRLKRSGMCPDWIVDAGCSTGAWTHCASRLYPEVSYLMIDPLLSEYDAWGNCLWHYDTSLRIERLEAAIGSESGELEFNVSPDLYNSSFQDDRTGVEKRVHVPVITLDSLLERPELTGRIWLKLDLQFAEHLALEGGEHFLERVDVCFIELSLWKQVPDCCDLQEMIDRFFRQGFRVFDECGGWRNHTTGRLFQMDLVFMRQELFVRGTPEEACS